MFVSTIFVWAASRRWTVIHTGLTLLWALSLGASATDAGIISIAKTVAATAGPWLDVNGGLNTAFQYGMHDQTAATVFSVNDGIDFSAGNSLTVSYISGLVSAGGSFPLTDANGIVSGPVNNGKGSSGTFFPSLYFNPTDYPANLNELVGTFANSSGAIVGTPFKVGDTRTLTIPVGATALELGVNDDAYSDNSGSWLINVTGTALTSSTVPLPPAAWPALGVMGLIGAASASRAKKRHA